jgi:hypothetical protein
VARVAQEKAGTHRRRRAGCVERCTEAEARLFTHGDGSSGADGSNLAAQKRRIVTLEALGPDDMG